MFGLFLFGLCRRQPRYRQIHRQVCWKLPRISGVVGKQRNIGFVGFLGNVEQKWCRKYRKWLYCEIFVTKSKLKTSLAVWRNLLPYIFQGGLQPGSRSRRAAPAHNNIATCTQTHRDVSIVHCVRIYIIVYSTPYRLFLFVAENRLTYSSRTWNYLQVQKQKTHRKSLVMERLLVNARSCSEPQRISKLLYRFKTVDIYLQTVLHQCFHR